MDDLRKEVLSVTDTWVYPARAALKRIERSLELAATSEDDTYEDLELACRDNAHDLDEVIEELQSAREALLDDAQSANELHYNDPKRGRV